MSSWSFYDAKTGVFSGRRFDGNRQALERNTPPGTVAIEGRFDRFAQRVDVATGEVVIYEPPAEVLQAVRRSAALSRIQSIEQEQPRAVREALIAVLPDGPARARLQAIEDRIAVQRSVVTAEEAVGDLVPERSGDVVVDPLRTEGKD